MDEAELKRWNEPGLHTVHDSSRSQAPAQIDIVAVHGLNFKNNIHHATETWTKDGKLWLRDFLPDSLATPSRVMLFSYNSSPGIGSAAIKLDEHATFLLQHLNLARKRDPTRPLVFICHSLGGLVTKASLIEAKLSSSYSSIWEATRVIAFFATPHHGGNYASVGEKAVKLVKALGLGQKNDLLKALKRTSDECTRRFEQSRDLFENLHLISFYETQPYGKLGLIVDKRSGTLNLPSFLEKQVAMNADHSSICKFATLDDSLCKLAIETIADEIEQALGGAPEPIAVVTSRLKSKNMHWCIPTTANALFTGRSEILDRIEAALLPTNQKEAEQQRRFVITGIGGMGKSEICLKFVERVRPRFWGIFWVDVNTRQSAENDFEKIAERVESSTRDIEEVLLTLSNLEEDWLLILDNADDPDTDYGQYYPSGTRGAVLMTSRNPECEQHGTSGSQELGTLDEEESLSLLLRTAKVPKDSWVRLKPAAKLVLDCLGYHTLAISQAGAYVAHGYCSMEQYPSVYQQHRERFLKFSNKQAPSRYRNVYATFEASLERLELAEEDTSKDALDLLCILSFCHFDNFPTAVFEDTWIEARKVRSRPEPRSPIARPWQWHVTRLPAFVGVDKSSWDPFRLHQATQLLESLALVKRGEFEGSPTISTVSMHPLVHEWFKVRQDSDRKHELWQMAACAIGTSLVHIRKWRPYRKHLVIHCQMLFDAPIKKLGSRTLLHEEVTLLYRYALYVNSLREAHALSAILNQMFRELELDPDEPVDDYLDLYKLHSRNQSDVGRNEHSIRLYGKILAVYELTVDEDHRRMLWCQQGLAFAYIDANRIEQAIALLQHVAEVMEESYPEDDRGRLNSQRDLAFSYMKNGQINEAIELFEQVQKIRSQSVDANDPELLDTQYQLACAYLDNGQTKQAIALLEKVNELETVALSDSNLDRLMTQENLASAYYDDNRLEEALELREWIVKMAQSTLSEKDPEALTAQHNLALSYHKMGRRGDAIRMMEKVIEVDQTFLRGDEDQHLVTMRVLADFYYEEDRYGEAAELMEHVVAKRKATLREDHPDLLDSEYELARALNRAGRYGDALKSIENVIEVEARVFEEDNENKLKAITLRKCILEAIEDAKSCRSIQSQSTETISGTYEDKAHKEDPSLQLPEKLKPESDEESQVEKGIDSVKVAKKAAPGSEGRSGPGHNQKDSGLRKAFRRIVSKDKRKI